MRIRNFIASNYKDLQISGMKNYEKIGGCTRPLNRKPRIKRF